MFTKINVTTHNYILIENDEIKINNTWPAIVHHTTVVGLCVLLMHLGVRTVATAQRQRHTYLQFNKCIQVN